VTLKYGRDAGRKRAGTARAESDGKKVPEERFVRARGEREEVRCELLKVLPETVGETAEIFLKHGVTTGGVAQSDELG
jgi:hypothetical protein